MVSTRPLISKSSSPCTNLLVTVPRAPITIGITITFMFHCFSIPWQGRDTYLSFSFLSILLCGQLEQQSPNFDKFHFSCWLLQDLIVLPYLGNPFVSQNPTGVYVFHSQKQILCCVYTIFSYVQIQISCTIPSGSPCPPIVFSLILFLS